MKIHYPIEDIKSLEQYISRTKVGAYPIAMFNRWHGGCHQTVEKEIRAIADGRIIAYRLCEDYLTLEVDGTSIQYSHGFVLLQHEYKSPSGLTYPFYTLYNHLMSIKEYKEGNNRYKGEVPPMFAKIGYAVKKEPKTILRGIDTYKLGIEGKPNRKQPIFFPKGSKITLLKKNGKQIVCEKDKRYHKAEIKDPLSVTLADEEVYIWHTAYKDNKVTYSGDTKTIEEVLIYEETSTTSKIKGRLKGETKVKIDTKATAALKTKGWYALQDDKGYIEDENIKKVYSFDSDQFTTNKVIKCDFPIKAGEVLGHTGIFGSFNVIDRRSSHLEVFSFEDPKELLKGNQEDKDNNLSYYRLAKGTKLQANVVKDSSLAKHTPVELVKKEKDYCLLKINKSTYAGQSLWVKHSAAIKKEVTKEVEQASGPEDLTIQKTVKKTITTLEEVEVNDKFNLQESISTVYLVKPIDKLKDCQTLQKLEGEIAKLKKAKDGDKKWYWIEESRNIKGWVEEDKLERYSPYDWEAFGFKALEAGTDYCYTVEDTKKGTKNAEFIKKVWEQLDYNGNKIISKEEWNVAFKRLDPLRTLTKLVCKHTNEWAYEEDEVLDAMKELYDQKIKDSKAKNSNLDTQYLEKERDRYIKLLKEQLDNLLFWKHIEKGEQGLAQKAWDYFFANEEEEKITKNFSSDQKEVWHFHPIAFVQQMKRVIESSVIIQKRYSCASWIFKSVYNKEPIYYSSNNSVVHHVDKTRVRRPITLPLESLMITPHKGYATNVMDGSVLEMGKMSDLYSLSSNDYRLWEDLLMFEKSDEYKKVFNQADKGRILDQQEMDWAVGDMLNTDYYALRITKLPNGMNKNSLFITIRKNLHNHINEFYANLRPHNDTNSNRIWNSNNPTGAIMTFEGKELGFIPVDDSAVLTTKSTDNYWVFTPVGTGWDWEHPLAGHRQFGLSESKDGTFIFYTRAVDMLWDIEDYLYNKLLDDRFFWTAHFIWTGVMNSVTEYINSSGGKAEVTHDFNRRIDWNENIKDEHK